MGERPRVLFLCTGNSVRSQMAEGWTRELLSERYEAYSAGIEPRGLDRRAAEVMKEAGVGISAQRSKHVREVKGIGFDTASPQRSQSTQRTTTEGPGERLSKTSRPAVPSSSVISVSSVVNDVAYVVTLCDSAAQACPVFPAKTRLLHRGFDDPAQASASKEELLSVFRRVRDEIREFVLSLPGLLEDREAPGEGSVAQEEQS